MRGGKRENSGRKPVPKEKSKAKPTKSIRCTDTEYQQIKEFLKELRSGKQ